MKSTVAAIDFGTSKIVTLVVESSGEKKNDILGKSDIKYNGYYNGEWCDSNDVLNDCIKESIEVAQAGAKRKIHEINVGVPGEFTRVYAVETTVAIQGADPRVEPKHVEMAFANADQKLSPVRGVVIHRSPAWFMVDGGTKVMEPVGQKGSELKAFISFVVADTFFLDDVMARLKELDITITGFFSTSTGEAMLYIMEEDRKRTSILIDMGYLCTDVMAVEGDAIIFQKTLQVGGKYIATDLSEGLSISLESAEQIKREFVYGISKIEQEYSATMEDGIKKKNFSQDEVSQILMPRVDEMADMINECIEESGIKLGKWSTVYLTGGGLVMNRGGREYLASKLDRPVKETLKRTTKLPSPIYASSMGLMNLIIDTVEANNAPATGLGGGIREFFRSLLGS